MEKRGLFAVILVAIWIILMIVFSGVVSADLSPGNISSCGTISSAGTYTLNASVNSSEDCITISSNNVMLDGNGKTINSSGGKGIVLDSAADKINITIKNANIVASSYGIQATASIRNIFFNNTISSTGHGFFTMSASSDNITNNIISTQESGIFFMGSSNSNIILNNTITTKEYGVYSYSSSSNTISNNTISSTDSGIQLSTSTSDKISNNTISSTNSGIYLSSALSDIVSNNNVSSGNGYYDINSNSDANNLSLIDQIVSKYRFETSSNVIFINSTYGSISLFGISGTGTNLIGNSSSDIQIGNDSVYVNASAVSGGLNKSANVTLYNLSSNYAIPAIMRNGNSTCNATTSPSCYNFTSLNAGNISFNVSSWSNYSIVDIGKLTSCGTLSQSGAYVLQNNISVNGTCFNITASNVTLNFGNYSINGNNTGYGIYMSNSTASRINLGSILSFLYRIYLYLGMNNYVATNSDSYNFSLSGTGNTTLVAEMNNSLFSYTVLYDGISCSSNPNCTLNSNSNGVINVSLNLD